MTLAQAFDFAGLYRRHANDVFRYALFLSGNHATAEDIVSETFVRVWGARDRVELPTVRSYLLAIARNLFLQGLRKQRRETAIDEHLPDPVPHPGAAHEANTELARVLAQLMTLPEVDRTALLLRADEGLSYDEIAAILNLSPVAARVKVHRARARLAAPQREGNS